ncbi:hypothetical protein D7X33_35250, partial [Butyricicoccus sp. 1XD8-22]
AGTFVHDYIEGVYKNEKDKQQFSHQFNEKMIENEFLGIEFPNEQIRDGFIADVKHYTEHFKLLDGKHLLEKLIVFEIEPDIWIQGYVDMIQVTENKDINVIDWKTSSKFSGKQKLLDAGRQLVMYKVGLESNPNVKVSSVKWCMLKYIYVCHIQKNKKVKRKMCSRRKWVKEMKSTFEKEMLSNGMDDLLVSLEIDEAIKNNNIDNLPDYIKDKFWLEDCYVEYEVDDDKINELKGYINRTINEIESLNKEDESQWTPVNIEDNSFYCNHLCNHRESCKFLKEYKKQLSNKTEVKLDDLFK